MGLLGSRVMLLASFILAAALPFAGAQGTDENLVEYRQRLMAAQGASMGSIGDLLKFKLDYSTEHVQIHAKNISEYAKLIDDVFKKEIAAGATDAKPEIWKAWADFSAKAKTLETEAAKLAEAAGGGDMKAVMPFVKSMGDACKGCHDGYRKPKEESYKNK